MAIQTTQRVLSAASVLSKTKELLTGRREYGSAQRTSISIDSLMLLFQASPSEMLPIIQELHDAGSINWFAPANTKSKGNLGAIGIADVSVPAEAV